MIDINKEREAFEADQNTSLLFERIEYIAAINAYMPKFQYANHLFVMQAAERFNFGWSMWQKAKSQAGPTWIPVEDNEPPMDIMVLICWADAPDVTPEQDYMTIDEDLNNVWANYDNDPPSHWMHFHKVPQKSGAEM